MGKRKTPNTIEAIEEADASKPTKNVDLYDSSDEEDLRNTIGNIPVQWYDEYEHIGYDLSGKKIAKAEDGKKKGEIDNFLEKMEDPEFWRKVFDQQTGGNTVLNEEQVEQLNCIVKNRYPKIGYNPYEPFLDIYSSQKEIHPISNRPEHKRSFIPSADERRKVRQMVHAIKMGWRKRPDQESDEEDRVFDESEEVVLPKHYDLWSSEEHNPKSKTELARLRMHLPAPKVAPPTHSESYNPPAEYLFDEAEKSKWKNTEPEKRRINFIPQKFDSLRTVPFYRNFFNERLERCLDLYLAPRQRKMRLNVDPNDLLPELPNPRDLQPFPTTLAFYMKGHAGQVRSVGVEPERGELLVSGGEDKTVRVWYIPTGKCLKIFKMSAPVTCVAYCPNSEKTLVLVSCESSIVSVLNIDVGDKLMVANTNLLLTSLNFNNIPMEKNYNIKWSLGQTTKLGKTTAVSVELLMDNKIRNVSWHSKGDYFATVGFEVNSNTVFIHRLSKCASVKPFSKKKGIIQQVLFHPTESLFFVATQQHIRIYDLVKSELRRKLFTGSRFVSSMVLHPHGNNLFVGGLDRVFTWLDMELSAKPWKTLKHHNGAIRDICYHQRRPLLATVSDDATAIIYHAKVSPDLMKENELVPVKKLAGHHQQLQSVIAEDENGESVEKVVKSAQKLAILSAIFHPTQAWLITAGADGRIGLFSY